MAHHKLAGLPAAARSFADHLEHLLRTRSELGSNELLSVEGASLMLLEEIERAGLLDLWEPGHLVDVMADAQVAPPFAPGVAALLSDWRSVERSPAAIALLVDWRPADNARAGA